MLRLREVDPERPRLLEVEWYNYNTLPKVLLFDIADNILNNFQGIRLTAKELQGISRYIKDWMQNQVAMGHLYYDLIRNLWHYTPKEKA